jgi:hypothetical protein
MARQQTSFGPDEIDVMAAAYDDALRALGVSDGCDPLAELIATKILHLAQHGELDPQQMRRSLLSALETAMRPSGCAVTAPLARPCLRRSLGVKIETHQHRGYEIQLTEAKPAWQAAIRPIDPKLPRVDWEAEPIAAAVPHIALAAAKRRIDSVLAECAPGQ